MDGGNERSENEDGNNRSENCRGGKEMEIDWPFICRWPGII